MLVMLASVRNHVKSLNNNNNKNYFFLAPSFKVVGFHQGLLAKEIYIGFAVNNDNVNLVLFYFILFVVFTDSF